MSETIIKMTGGVIRQQGNTILKNVNVEIQSGEFVYLIGRVGSGKSSFLKTLYAELSLDYGTAEVAGFSLKKIKKSQIPLLRRKCGIVFQDFRLLIDRNVYANLEFVLRATGWRDRNAIRERIENVLEKVGMTEKQNQMPHQLSGGEQQRIVLARALLNAPPIILADEPTGNIDPETSYHLVELLQEISHSGKTVIIATHQYDLIGKYPGRVLRCENGELFESEYPRTDSTEAVEAIESEENAVKADTTETENGQQDTAEKEVCLPEPEEIGLPELTEEEITPIPEIQEVSETIPEISGEKEAGMIPVAEAAPEENDMPETTNIHIPDSSPAREKTEAEPEIEFPEPTEEEISPIPEIPETKAKAPRKTKAGNSQTATTEQPDTSKDSVPEVQPAEEQVKAKTKNAATTKAPAKKKTAESKATETSDRDTAKEAGNPQDIDTLLGKLSYPEVTSFDYELAETVPAPEMAAAVSPESANRKEEEKNNGLPALDLEI